MNKLSPRTTVIVIAACLLGVVLALVGAELPDGTSFAQALPFWITVVFTAAFLLTTVGAAIDNLIEDISATPLLKTCIIGAATTVLVTIPLALMCLPIDDLMPDSDRLFEAPSTADSMATLFWRWADQYLNLLPAVVGFWIFVKALDWAFPPASEMLVRRGDVGDPDNHRSTEIAGRNERLQEPRPSALERRFPEISGLTLLAIEADEHYIRLHTDAGSKHVLYRFRDALRDVEELAGLRVHRSWWVAEEAIEDLEQSPSSFGLRLKGGIKAPVSQTYRREVEMVIEARSKSG